MVNPSVICSIVDSFLEARKGDMRRQLHATLDTLLDELMRGVSRQVKQLLVASHVDQPTVSSSAQTFQPNSHSEAYPPPVFPLPSFGESSQVNREAKPPTTTSTVFAVKSGLSNLASTSKAHIGVLGGNKQNNLTVNNSNPSSSAVPEKEASGSKFKFFKSRRVLAIKKENSDSSETTLNKNMATGLLKLVDYSSGGSSSRKRSRYESSFEEDEVEQTFTSKKAKRTNSSTSSNVTTNTKNSTETPVTGKQNSKKTKTTNTSTKKTASSSRKSKTPKVFPCKQEGCEKTLKGLSDFLTHQRRHLKITPFYCTWPGCVFRGYEHSASCRHVKQTHFRRTAKDGTPEQIAKWDPTLYIETDEDLLNTDLLPTPEPVDAPEKAKDSKKKEEGKDEAGDQKKKKK